MLQLRFQELITSLLPPSKTVAVAVSGGVDSIVLLHLMTKFLKKRTPPIVLTVNHNLRIESSEEANFVANYAKQLGIKSFILEWKRTSEITSNIQSQAREARYKLLTDWCKNNTIQYLIVGHHKDDQAENFLIRLERGSGIDGLSSMNYSSFFHGICILRPLLCFSRHNIENYAKTHQLKWIEDKSNQNIKYRRSLYRNLLNSSDNHSLLTDRICMTILHIQRAKKALMHYTQLAFDQCINIHMLGYIEIKLKEFFQLPEEIALRVLLYSIMLISNKHYKPRYKSLISIFHKILNGNINHTLSECKIKNYRENILIIRESSKIKEVPINLPTKKIFQWDNRFNCSIVTSKECRVVITSLGKNRKIPEHLKTYNCCNEVFYSLPIVKVNNKIVVYPYSDNNEIKFEISNIMKKDLFYKTWSELEVDSSLETTNAF